jgi:hypothetical protein
MRHDDPRLLLTDSRSLAGGGISHSRDASQTPIATTAAPIDAAVRMMRFIGLMP